MASVATSRDVALSAAGADGATALTGGSQLALALAALFIAGAIAVSWTVLREGRGAATQATEAESFDDRALPDAA
jgi:hypothetical protein